LRFEAEQGFSPVWILKPNTNLLNGRSPYLRIQVLQIEPDIAEISKNEQTQKSH
jgi:hypothetical protein